MSKFAKVLLLSAMPVCLLTACSGSAVDNSQQQAQHDSVPLVSVKKQPLTQVVSGKATIEQSSTFVITAVSRGNFSPSVKAGSAVKAGSVLGYNAGNKIIAPVDAKVVSVAESSADVPKSFPLFTLKYEGFSISLNAKALLRSADIADVKGRFQVEDGVGPTNCLQIVQSGGTSTDVAASGSSKNDNADSTQTDESSAQSAPSVSSKVLTCLIDKSTEVESGQNATLVFNGKHKQSVLTLPVSAVAGRVQKGLVSYKKGDNWERKEVGLGISDGANIEITSGLHEGDVVAGVSPDLIPGVQ
ncbi:efflux RND transporter periplasmic adaptor subunit [Gardnerella vaginalis]|uniref:efflux RND transporter periplasmic adaptor subunit n=1 Tax=Gardnerella vaginalis TaxID=2702 RepID=UPI0039F115F1